MSVTEASPAGIDVEPVTRWMAENVGAKGPLAFTRIKGGHSNLTYRIDDAAGTAFVLRRPPLGELLPTAHDMTREWRFISAFHPTPVPVPPPLGYCDDKDVTGAPFYVMAFVEGHVLHDAVTAESALRRGRTPVGRALVHRRPRRHARRGSRTTSGCRRHRAQRGLHRATAQAVVLAVERVEDARACRGRRGPRRARVARARAGAGARRPRRLPARQLHHRVRRQDRGRPRLGDRDARRPARRRRLRPALVAGAGRSRRRAPHVADDRSRGSRAAPSSSSGTPSGPDATSRRSTSTSRSRTGRARASSKASMRGTCTARSTRPA